MSRPFISDPGSDDLDGKYLRSWNPGAAAVQSQSGNETETVDCICFSVQSHGQASTRVHCALNHTVYCQNSRIRVGENEQNIQTSPYVTRNGWTGAASWSEVDAGLEAVLSRVNLVSPPRVARVDLLGKPPLGGELPQRRWLDVAHLRTDNPPSLQSIALTVSPGSHEPTAKPY
eukprot:COSAG02_NODE_1233_length_13749_cov_13.003223_8_plen_174_part_00